MRSTRRVPVISLVLAAIVLTACGGIAGGNAKDDSVALENTTWVLESYGEQDSPQPALEGTEVTAVFDGTEGALDGSAGCNSYFASYEVSGSELAVSDVAYTEMFCLEPDGVMEQEQQYLTALAAAESYRVQDGQLHILCAADKVLMFSAS